MEWTDAPPEEDLVKRLLWNGENKTLFEEAVGKALGPKRGKRTRGFAASDVTCRPLARAKGSLFRLFISCIRQNYKQRQERQASKLAFHSKV